MSTEVLAYPEWLWPVIVTGMVQGLVTYGAIKVKFDWLFDRLAALEAKQIEDVKALSLRFDSMLLNEHRRAGDPHDT